MLTQVHYNIGTYVRPMKGINIRTIKFHYYTGQIIFFSFLGVLL